MARGTSDASTESWTVVSRPATPINGEKRGNIDSTRTATVTSWSDYAAIPDRVIPTTTEGDGVYDDILSKTGTKPYTSITASEKVEPQLSLNSSDATIIHADILIPGKGQPLKNKLVISSHGKIVSICSPSSDSLPSEYSHLPRQHVPALMPGLWECHAHFMGADPAKPINTESLILEHPASAGARAVRALRDTLYAGFTSCVDLGGYATELKKVVEEGTVLGPRLYGAGAAISMTAGHGDIFELPLGPVDQAMSVNSISTHTGAIPMIMADGIDECRKAVRINLRRGARCIKVLTSGGVTSRDDNPLLQQFSDEELLVIVSEAKRMGLVCAAHAIGKDGIMAAIRTGFKVIEHGSFIDQEVITAMKKEGVMLVATITPLQSIVDHREDYPKEMYEKALRIAEMHKANYAAAIKAGVKCALGSDLFGGTGTVLSPGLNGLEVIYAVQAGMSPLEAIEAATANGPLTLGEKQAPLSGQIKEGYDADLIGMEMNPLDDIEEVFGDTKRNLKWIWKGGKLVKAPGLDTWDVLGR